ncbi:hypothetical protein MRX96_052091, partial [Rhipicephalus microplus]
MALNAATDQQYHLLDQDGTADDQMDQLQGDHDTLKVALLWVAALGAICVAQFSSVLWAGYDHPSRVTTALYAATHRGLFSAGMAWVIYACLTDRAGFLTSLLKWPGWAPLSRLSFSAYMIQDIVIQHEWESLASRVDGGYYFMA